MGTLADIVFDCRHPASLARFWVALLDDYEVAPYDDEELARLAARGVDDVEDGPTVLVVSSTGGPPRGQITSSTSRRSSATTSAYSARSRCSCSWRSPGGSSG